MNDQQNILSKQASILNEKDKQIDRNEVILKNNKMKLDTHKRKTIYNEKDDINSNYYISLLNWVLFILVAVVVLTLGKLIKDRYS